jgi:hypothetical protein
MTSNRTPIWAIVCALGRIGDERAIRPLMRVIKKEEYEAESVLAALINIITASASRACTDDLRAVADLTGVHQSARKYISADGNVTTVRVPVDCSGVTQLAREELLRRGSKATAT